MSAHVPEKGPASPQLARFFTQLRLFVALACRAQRTVLAPPRATPTRLVCAAFSRLAAYSRGQVLIEGHTDNVGSTDANQILSKNHADAVLEYLQKQTALAEFLLHREGLRRSSSCGDERDGRRPGPESTSRCRADPRRAMTARNGEILARFSHTASQREGEKAPGICQQMETRRAPLGARSRTWSVR